MSPAAKCTIYLKEARKILEEKMKPQECMQSRRKAKKEGIRSLLCDKLVWKIAVRMEHRTCILPMKETGISTTLRNQSYLKVNYVSCVRVAPSYGLSNKASPFKGFVKGKT